MKAVTTLILCAASFASVSGCSAHNATITFNTTATSSGVGAAYFMTNAIDGNFVISAAIDTDGKLSLAKAVPTGGNGSHAQTGNPIGFDALFSQSPIAVSDSGNVLVTVNAGADTISAFKIDPSNPANITALGEPVSTQGDFPVSVAFNKAGDRVCALNGGQVNGVICYSVNATGLVPIPESLRLIGQPQITPAFGPSSSLSQVIFTEDEKHLVVAVKGINVAGQANLSCQGYLAVWDVAANGSLSQNFTKVPPKIGGASPFAMVIIPGANAIFAADTNIGYDIFDLSDVSTAATSNRSSANMTPSGGNCWSGYSNKTGSYYLVAPGSDNITEVSVSSDLTSSVLATHQLPVTANILDISVASFNNQSFAYVLAPNMTSISVLGLDAPGSLAMVESYNWSSITTGAGFTFDPFYVAGMATYVKP